MVLRGRTLDENIISASVRAVPNGCGWNVLDQLFSSFIRHFLDRSASRGPWIASSRSGTAHDYTVKVTYHESSKKSASSIGTERGVTWEIQSSESLGSRRWVFRHYFPWLRSTVLRSLGYSNALTTVGWCQNDDLPLVLLTSQVFGRKLAMRIREVDVSRST